MRADLPHALLQVISLHDVVGASLTTCCTTLSGCALTLACGPYRGQLVAGTEVVGVLTASGGTLTGAIIITTESDSGPTMSCIYDVTGEVGSRSQIAH